MSRIPFARQSLALLASLVLAPAALAAASAAPVGVSAQDTTARLVVRYKNPGVRAQGATSLSSAASEHPLQVRVASVRTNAAGATIVQLDKTVSVGEAQSLARALQQGDSNILSAEPDIRVRPLAAPSVNDTYGSLQWGLQDAASGGAGAANFLSSWARVPVTTRVTVAVIDTGYLPHSDVGENQSRGVNFINDATMAGNGTGRSTDPTDTGDFCASENMPSSWHGLKVASLIAAIPNNSAGIAGAAGYHAHVQQIRALGRCSAYLSDVADALRWAVGDAVTGFATNATPARVVNLSLGSFSGMSCPQYFRDALDVAAQRNAVVLAAAGNDSQGSLSAPANCPGVISVGAHTRSGDLAQYSNYSSEMTLTAPGGGNCWHQQGAACQTSPIQVLSNSGTQLAGAELLNSAMVGTSVATPFVSSAAALLIAANPQLTAAQVRSMLASSTRPHPDGTFCSTNPTLCGAGMLDVSKALDQLNGVLLTVSGTSSPVAGNTAVTLKAAATGGAAPYTFTWTQVSGPIVSFSQSPAGLETSTISFTAPATKGEAIKFRITVQGQDGSRTLDETSVTVNNKPVLAQPADRSLAAGASLMVNLQATDADGDLPTYGLEKGPTGARIEGSTLVWTNATAGTHVFRVYAADGSSQSDSKSFTVTVGGDVSGGGDASSGGGGGGAAGLGWLVLLASGAGALALLRRKRPN